MLISYKYTIADPYNRALRFEVFGGAQFSMKNNRSITNTVEIMILMPCNYIKSINGKAMG